MSTQRRKKARKVRERSTKPPKTPLLSSNQIHAALRRLGFVDGPAKGSSHLSMNRLRPDGGHDVTSVVMGRKEVPRGTLEGILKTANVSMQEFLEKVK